MIEEIKNKIGIKWLVEKLGLTVYRGDFVKSIYKDEKKPSLKLYPQTNSYYDFSAGKGGDVINFYADARSISNGDAIKELAYMAGVELKSITQN